jgi:mono/diheme cytochrome c family protein
MQKFKWVIGISLMMLAIAIGCKTQFTTTTSTFTAVPSQQALEHGKDLAFSICAGCHYNHGVNKFIGTQIEDVPGIAGKVYAANLTHSKTHGIAPKYTDAQIKYLLKTGVAKDGRFLSYMLRPNMSDGDINDIIVFLRSDDPSLAAADTTVGLTHFTMIGKAYMNSKAKPVPYKDGIKRPENPAALGYYLVDNLGCFHCHSKSLTKLNLPNPDQTPGYLAGGLKMKGINGIDVYVPNITPDKQSGIGTYTREQFLKAVKDGQSPTKKLKAPMPKFDRLSDTEVDAIYAYIQTVPAKFNKVR